MSSKINVGAYWEVKLQLRPYDKEVIEYVYRHLKKNKKEIVLEMKLKEGLDIYLADRKFAASLGKRLTKVFKGETKISRKLFTRDRVTSKQVYRVTVLFRRIKEVEEI